MTVHRSSLFALSVFTGRLDGFDAHAPQLIDRICKLREAGQGMQASNQHAFHSLRDFHAAQDDATYWYRQSILAFATEALAPLVTGLKPWEVTMTHSWAIAADRGGWLTPHNHFPSPWSGVFYLDVERTLGFDPRDSSGRLELLCPIPLAEVFGLPSSIPISPENGAVVLFPGALQHVVHPHRSEHTRYSVSFNLAIRPKVQA